MTKARDLADIVSNLSSNAGKAVVVNDGGTELVFGDAGSFRFIWICKNEWHRFSKRGFSRSLYKWCRRFVCNTQ